MYSVILSTGDQVAAQVQKDKEAAIQMNNDAIKQRRVGLTGEEFSNNEAAEADNEEEAMLTESGVSVASSSSSKRTMSKKLVNCIVDYFPELADGAFLELVDGMLQLVVAADEEEEEDEEN